jgi:hypothetical protein
MIHVVDLTTLVLPPESKRGTNLHRSPMGSTRMFKPARRIGSRLIRLNLFNVRRGGVTVTWCLSTPWAYFTWGILDRCGYALLNLRQAVGAIARRIHCALKTVIYRRVVRSCDIHRANRPAC